MRANLSRTPYFAVAVIGCAIGLLACGSKTATPAPDSQSAAAAAAPAEAPAPTPAPPAAAITQASWSPDVLEELVAPIALYPDQLVGQILAASVNSQEVLDAGNWLVQNQELKGDQLDAAAQKAGLGPAMRALVQFPTIVDMMCQQLDWTRQLGAAFTSDQASVLAAVQRLRAEAQKVGNLKSTPQQTVETTTANQQTIIEIKPANPQIIYVPQYNPQVIYTTPPAPAPAPQSSSGTVSTSTALVGGLIAFGLGIAIGSAISQPDYCYPHWRTGVVFVGPRPFYPPAYVYRPVYGPAYRPAYGYHPPPGYRNNYVNGDVNINVNRNNYFTQFDRNQDLRRSDVQRPPGASNWKGQTTYAGSRNTGAPVTRGPAADLAATRNPAASARPKPSPTGGPATRPAAPAGVQTAGRNGPAGAANGRGPAGAASAPGGAGKLAAGRTPGAAQMPAAGAGAQRGPPVDRGYGTGGGARAGARPMQNGAAQPPTAAATRDRAFSGAASGNGGFERSASARGRASAGAGGGGAQAQGNRAAARR